jgi:hypothetical protein
MKLVYLNFNVSYLACSLCSNVRAFTEHKIKLVYMNFNVSYLTCSLRSNARAFT